MNFARSRFFVEYWIRVVSEFDQFFQPKFAVFCFAVPLWSQLSSYQYRPLSFILTKKLVVTEHRSVNIVPLVLYVVSWLGCSSLRRLACFRHWQGLERLPALHQTLSHAQSRYDRDLWPSSSRLVPTGHLLCYAVIIRIAQAAYCLRHLNTPSQASDGIAF